MRIANPASADAAPKQVTNIAANVAVTVKDGPGNLFRVLAHNANAAARYLMFFNIASGTPSGAPYIAPILVAPNGMATMDFGPNGTHFPAGITWGWSSDPTTYTAGTAANHVTTAWYR